MDGREELGARVRTDYRCAACGYGAVASVPPPLCPMCGASAWEHAPWRPFSGRRAEPLLQPSAPAAEAQPPAPAAPEPLELAR